MYTKLNGNYEESSHPVKMAILDIVLNVFGVFVFVYDVITFPIYALIQQAWKERTKQNLGKLTSVEESNENVSFLREKGESKIYQEIIVRAKVDTVTKAFNYSVQKYQDKDCLGTRQILGEEDEVQKNGKVFKKLALGDYEWMTYNMVHASALSFGAGLRFQLGQKPKSLITIYSETRAEWMISCLGAFSQNIGVATVYSNLGDDAVVHALNETGTEIVVTSHDLLPRFRKMLSQLPNIQRIIFFEDQLQPTSVNEYKKGVDILPFRSVVTEGANILSSMPVDGGENTTASPTPDDTAIVMYTSGSTGTPKGVVLTHRNLVACMKCIMFMLNPKPDECYIAYLPLAHVLELLSENTMMLLGIKVGYSSPNTMTDMSTKVRKGNKGDASVLMPTMMCAVPLIMDRIYKNITDSMKKRGPGFEKVFEFCYNYKQKWTRSGRKTPIVDGIVFNKIRALLGGKMEFIIVGGAPLSRETHEFIRVCLGAIVVPGYSLTESCCTGTVMENSDLGTDTVGKPMTGVEVRLVDWEEGNYKVTDRPNPRGEIIIGGDSVAKGYFDANGETKDGTDGTAAFFEEGGKRWFRTGDIGEFNKDGFLKIIDRKKDLVKLQLGEYVSLGKVESTLKTHPLVENICVYGDPYRSFVVALVVPSKSHIEAIAHKLGKTISFEKLIDDKDVRDAVLKELVSHGTRCRLEKFELPAAVTLVHEQWTPESGLITASFKLKRRVMQNFYQQHINRMYA